VVSFQGYKRLGNLVTYTGVLAGIPRVFQFGVTMLLLENVIEFRADTVR
jgi:hypothetical protein